MDSNHKKWPNSWDYHISQYCDFYFCDKDIKYLDKSFWTEARTDSPDVEVMSMNLRFQLGDHQYMVNIGKGNGTHFSCSIFYKKPLAPMDETLTDVFVTSPGGDIAVLDDVAGMGGHNMSANELMEFAEDMMWEDYNRREGRDDDGDDGENDPVEPFSPTEIIEPELTLV